MSIKFKIGFLATLLFLGALKSQAQNVVPDEAERAALLAIYNSTDGANWVENKRWTLTRINAYPDPDSVLYGIETFNGDITEIGIFAAGLSGKLPYELNSLTALQTLSITSNNGLNDTIPNLSTLQALVNFDLSNNSLQDSVRAWIGNLTNLQTLNLSFNSLTGPIPSAISNLTQLRNLMMSGVNLSMADAIPASLSTMDALQSIRFESCGLTPESVPNGISDLPGLSSLFLSGNPSFAMPDGAFPDLLLDLPNLSQLVLQSNNLRRLPDHFSDLTSLNYLDLANNNFSDSSRLGDVVDTLRYSPNLRTLILNSCSITGLPPNFDKLTTVTDLYLSNDPLDPSQCLILGSMHAVKNLYIQGDGLTDLPVTLSNLSTLETLYASNNNLYPVPAVVGDIPNLKHLYLDNNGIEGLPSWFGSGIMSTQLLTLDLHNNSVTTSLPASFGSMTALTTLNMSNNNLDGTLSTVFTTLTGLVSLNLSNNQIELPLPDLSGLPSLGYIYLQNNNLTGAAPAFLSNTSVRKYYVDLSHNHLTQLTTFNADASLTIIVNYNKLNFVNLLKVHRPVQSYIYVPQDTVNSRESSGDGTGGSGGGDGSGGGTDPDEVTAYEGGTLVLTASVDRDTPTPSLYQWFKYVDGVNDIPMTSSPSADGWNFELPNFNPSDTGRYYYKITNPDLPGLSLTSQTTRVRLHPCITDMPGSISPDRYVCAFIFDPPKNTRNCSGTSFNWDFGDGVLSTEKSPIHGYASGGTYNVTLSMTFRCGSVCNGDTVLTASVTFNPDDTTTVIKDTVIVIGTQRKSHIITASASSFSDVWALQHQSADLADMNSYLNGTRGVWRNDASFVYDVPREQSPNVNVATDGTFSMDQFSWGGAFLDPIPSWTRATTMTQYSPFSYELENRDVLGVYTAALYDYGGHLPSATGVNMRNNEMGFTSFEYLDGAVTGNLIFGTLPQPAYHTYEVVSGYGRMAIVKADIHRFDDVTAADVVQRTFAISRAKFSITSNDPIVCKQVHPDHRDWTILVFKTSPANGAWSGSVRVRRQIEPLIVANIDNSFAHSGRSSLKIASETTFKQEILELDSGKAYMLNAWVSVQNISPATPTLGSGLGVDVVFKDSHNIVRGTFAVAPQGRIIEGWQQVTGTFICPIKDASVELKFKTGSTGTAWYDDLRIHPQRGNMKTFVYDVRDYRLRAVLDEENFASFYFYDQEGNLYIMKKETEEGIKTISENISYVVER